MSPVRCLSFEWLDFSNTDADTAVSENANAVVASRVAFVGMASDNTRESPYVDMAVFVWEATALPWIGQKPRSMTVLMEETDVCGARNLASPTEVQEEF
jgi:hypothetical protein